MDKQTLIDIYEKEIQNLEFSLKNGNKYSEEEIKLINIRIADRKQFLYYVNKLP